MTVRAVLDDLLRDPAMLDAIVNRLVARIRTQVPEYDRISEATLRQGNRQIMIAALVQLREGRLPEGAELREINSVGADRARQGISLTAVLAAYSVAGEEFWNLLSTEWKRRGANDAALLQVMHLIWRWLDVVTVAAAEAHREVELRSAREDEQRMGDALRALLTQAPSELATQQYLVQLGLTPGGRYSALRGRLAPGVPVSALRATMADGALVAAVVNQDVLGLLTSQAELLPSLGTFGIGPEVADLRASYVAAGRALTAALRMGLTGQHSLATLRLAGVAAVDDEMTAILTERLLVPLRVKGNFGEEIWRSVLGYLAHELRIDETAAAMHVHPNTLRHRLTHFSDLTGADLRNPADIAEIWWLSTVPAPNA
nr:helix-turn-helix domain-containing protein [Kibdelosporangium sp. MJ126-NF4]CEL14125.1 transcriptional regulator [Kibdelosporangium sp. MJ126-NF4]CTQ88492.1 transcriptional regulator [Kibdelosporangium sp. MJ126-NF4]